MTDKERYESHVSALCEELRGKFFLYEYSYSVIYSYDDALMEFHGSAAEMKVDTRYLNFTLKLGSRPFEYFQNGKWWTLAEVLVHEFCHILTEPLYGLAVDMICNANAKLVEDIRERQTQRICNVILNLLPKEFYTPKESGDAKETTRGVVAESDSEGVDGGAEGCVRLRDAQEDRETEQAVTTVR